MESCKGCREQQTDGPLCLSCVEDLNHWLREIPSLYAELGSVRLPGSVRVSGPRSGPVSRTGSPAPVRLEVVDLLDRGETLDRLLKWTDTGYDVEAICQGFRLHLLSIAGEPWAPEFWRDMRSLCRDLGRAVGQPEDRSVGKCPNPVSGDELCRGSLFRAAAGGVYCRRCGFKPEIADQAVWVTAREAATIVGKPIETIRTWFKRGQVGWGPPVAPNLGWLPIIVRRAQVATLPQSANLNHEFGAELSPHTAPSHRSANQVGDSSDPTVVAPNSPDTGAHPRERRSVGHPPPLTGTDPRSSSGTPPSGCHRRGSLS